MASNSPGRAAPSSERDLRLSLQQLVDTNRSYRVAIDFQARCIKKQTVVNKELKRQIATLHRNRLLYQEKLSCKIKLAPCPSSHHEDTGRLQVDLLRTQQALDKAEKKLQSFVIVVNQDVRLLQRWLQDNTDCTDRIREVQCPRLDQTKTKLGLVTKEQDSEGANNPTEELDSVLNLHPQDNTDWPERPNHEVSPPWTLSQRGDAVLTLTQAMKEQAKDNTQKTIEEYVAFLNRDIQLLQGLLQDRVEPSEDPGGVTEQQQDGEKSEEGCDSTVDSNPAGKPPAWWRKLSRYTSEFSGKVRKILSQDRDE